MVLKNSYLKELIVFFTCLIISTSYIQYQYYYSQSLTMDSPSVEYNITPPKTNKLNLVKVAPLQLHCMTEAIYYEARNQSELGQKAVAHVIINRTKSDKYPKSVCEVVHQKEKHTCQFTYFCEKHNTKIDMPSLEEAQKIAVDVLEKNESDFTEGAMYYHTIKVHPLWKNVKFAFNIGDHMFYYSV